MKFHSGGSTAQQASGEKLYNAFSAADLDAEVGPGVAPNTVLVELDCTEVERVAELIQSAAGLSGHWLLHRS